MTAPALSLLRQAYPGARIGFASESGRSGIVAAPEVLGDRGLVDAFFPMSVPQGRIQRLLARFKFFREMRKIRWDLGIVLLPAYPPLTMRLVRRFRLYLQLCGVKRILAPESILEDHRLPDGNLEARPSVTENLCRQLMPLGIPMPKTFNALLPPRKTPVPPGLELPSPAPRRYLAVGASANMPSKQWPLERYAKVLQALSCDFIPVYFGGEDSRADLTRLAGQVPGVLVISQPLPEVERIMRLCAAYLGNDTGLMHLAAALGLPCTAIFSCRQAPGMWEPGTQQKAILRAKALPCEGCCAIACPVPGHPCLRSIQPEEVLLQIRLLLAASTTSPPHGN